MGKKNKKETKFCKQGGEEVLKTGKRNEKKAKIRYIIYRYKFTMMNVITVYM